MTLLSYFFPVEKKYIVKPTGKISFEFEKEGYVFNRYSISAFCSIKGVLTPDVCCSDDLRFELPMKYFGNECNVMAEILLNRYDFFVSKLMMAQITTSLSDSESIYRTRIRSRMRELFNLVAFDRDTKDKRA